MDFEGLYCIPESHTVLLTDRNWWCSSLDRGEKREIQPEWLVEMDLRVEVLEAMVASGERLPPVVWSAVGQSEEAGRFQDLGSKVGRRRRRRRRMMMKMIRHPLGQQSVGQLKHWREEQLTERRINLSSLFYEMEMMEKMMTFHLNLCVDDDKIRRIGVKVCMMIHHDDDDEEDDYIQGGDPSKLTLIWEREKTVYFLGWFARNVDFPYSILLLKSFTSSGDSLPIQWTLIWKNPRKDGTSLWEKKTGNHVSLFKFIRVEGRDRDRSDKRDPLITPVILVSWSSGSSKEWRRRKRRRPMIPNREFPIPLVNKGRKRTDWTLSPL